MKILYVCRGNVGRSQIAMEFHNALRQGEAVSAGTDVDIEGQKLYERGPEIEVVTVMNELGIDMSQNARTQVTKEMLDKFDQVIVIIAEKQHIPDFLAAYPGAIFWDIIDIHKKNLEESRVLRDDIKQHVNKFVDNLNSEEDS